MSARDDTPSIREIAALTARLRELSAAGQEADPAERSAFLADKDALLERIETYSCSDEAEADTDDGLPDGRLLPPWPPGSLPAEMLDGIEERLSAPAEADDPLELESRLDALRRRIADRRSPSDQARADELNRWAQEDERPYDADESGRGW